MRWAYKEILTWKIEKKTVLEQLFQYLQLQKMINYISMA